MSPGDLLKILRTKGYTVSLSPDGGITASGVTPKDPERARKLLADNQAGLRAILEAEEILGARLR